MAHTGSTMLVSSVATLVIISKLLITILTFLVMNKTCLEHYDLIFSEYILE